MDDKDMYYKLKDKIMSAVEMAIDECMEKEDEDYEGEEESMEDMEESKSDKEKRKAAIIIGFKK